MKSHRIPAAAILPFLLGLALALAGCGTDRQDGLTGTDQVGVDDYAKIDLDQPDGGLTATDEAPAFGDPYLRQADAEAAAGAYLDPTADLPEVRRLEAAGRLATSAGDSLRPRFTFLRIVWGDLDGPVDTTTGLPVDGDLADWSGRLAVDRGYVIVRRLVRFEPADHLVRPRPDPRTVAWVSRTGGHFDGLLIEIVEPPLPPLPPDTTAAQVPPPPNRLHFAAAPFRGDWPVAELARLDQVFEAGAAGAIHFTGFTLAGLGPCPEGFLEGTWHHLDADGRGGAFRGLWVDVLGAPRGHLMGRYGLNAAGESVFFGKVIGRDGRFRGLLRGTWAPAAEPGRGEFHGRWRGAAGQVEGLLGGRWRSLPERPGGFFAGRWAADGDGEAVDQVE